MDDNIDLDSLNPNPENPRTISDVDFESLKKSITKHGDMAGIVFNTRTQRLVGGHQRTEAFRALGVDNLQAKVVITQRFDKPNKKGTTAVGYIVHDGEFYAFRQVDWDEAQERAANIAANRISGEFDKEALAEWDQWLLENAPELIEYTGQQKKEIDKLLGNEPEQAEDDDADERIVMSLTKRQYEIVQHAIATIRTKRNFSSEVNNDLEGNAIAAICEEWLAVNTEQ